MSIAVPLDGLANALAGFRFAYLVSRSADGRSHVVAVHPAVTAPGLRVTEPGRTTTANVAARPDVTLVWPPADPADHSLIVDGAAHVDGDGVVVVPERAVLHRPAPAPEPSTSACGADCVEIPVAGSA